jgi:phosphoglycolate phosphatase-like HAD superfamily hydrolase
MKNSTLELLESSIALRQKEVFVFDWDGTIFDSMQIKLENFSTILSQMVGEQMVGEQTQQQTLKKIKSWYIQLSGAPRKEIFSAILANIHTDYGIDTKSIDYDKFSSQLSLANRNRLVEAHIFPDAELFLTELIKKQKKVYISSSTPQEELDFLVKTKLNSFQLAHLSRILGSSDGFAKGAEHLSSITKELKCEVASILVIGDDLADSYLSQKAGVDCLVVDRENRFVNHTDVFRVESLGMLGDLI